MTPAEALLLGGLLIAMMLLIGVVLPAWLMDRPLWSEPVEPPVPPVGDPYGPALLSALARRAGLDGADT